MKQKCKTCGGHGFMLPGTLGFIGLEAQQAEKCSECKGRGIIVVKTEEKP